MKADIEEAGLSAADALGRVRSGVDRGIVRKKRQRAALVAGGVMVAAIAGIGAGVAWPNAEASAYISCQDPRVEGAFSTGGGFDMRDPVGFCLDYGDYTDGAGVAFDWGTDLTRDDLVACRLADGVAGVYVRTSGDCEAHGNSPWTAADAVLAEQITLDWREWHVQTFGSDPMPNGPITTPSQIANP